ncbi:putative family 17 glucosidase SCW4 [Leucoagaricus sp. SymC.cos]|nr:putative family 17 glucosidase SCW4 [Leucoagaricus sp. SymC.cos]
MKFAGSLVALLASLSGTLATTNFAGLTASNSIGGSGAYTCRTQAQWNDLANAARNSGFRSIRILGFDCNALPMASSAAASAGLTVLAGIYFGGTVAANSGAIDDQVNQFRSAVGQFGAGRYVGLTIGNENMDSPANIMNKVFQVQSTLRSAGINTPVSTVHNWVAIRDDPVFCQGDFVGANAHAFYDPNTPADQTGNFVIHTAVPMLRNTCGSDKQIIITESGWPSRGGSNGAAVASLGDEHSALLNLNCACRDDRSVWVYAFEYDDQLWKGNDNERSFGIFGKFDLNGDVFAPC